MRIHNLVYHVVNFILPIIYIDILEVGSESTKAMAYIKQAHTTVHFHSKTLTRKVKMDCSSTIYALKYYDVPLVIVMFSNNNISIFS